MIEAQNPLNYLHSRGRDVPWRPAFWSWRVQVEGGSAGRIVRHSRGANQRSTAGLRPPFMGGLPIVREQEELLHGVD